MPRLSVKSVAAALQPRALCRPPRISLKAPNASEVMASSCVNSTNCGVAAGGSPPGGAVEGHTQPGAAPLPPQLQRYQLGMSPSPSSFGEAARG